MDKLVTPDPKYGFDFSLEDPVDKPATPDPAPKPAPILGRRVFASIARDTNVFTRLTASAPAFSAARANGSILATLGDSLTIKGRLVSGRIDPTSSSSNAGSPEK